MNRTVSDVIENAANDLEVPRIDGIYQAVEVRRSRRDRRRRAGAVVAVAVFVFGGFLFVGQDDSTVATDSLDADESIPTTSSAPAEAASSTADLDDDATATADSATSSTTIPDDAIEDQIQEDPEPVPDATSPPTTVPDDAAEAADAVPEVEADGAANLLVVPDLFGLDIGQAEAALRAAGLELGEVVGTDASCRVEVTGPRAGSEAPAGSGIDIVLAECAAPAVVSEPILVTEQQRLTSPRDQDRNIYQDHFGREIAMVDGTLFVGSPSGGLGELFVFEQVNGRWELQQTLTEEELTHRVDFFFGLVFDADGDTLALDTTEGVAVYNRVNGSWQLQQEVDLQVPLAEQGGISPYIAIGGDSIAVVKGNGIHVLARTDGVWAQSRLVPEPTQGADSEGVLAGDNSLAVDDDIVVVGKPGTSEANIWRLVDDAWVLQQTLSKPTTVARLGFGAGVTVDDGTVVIADPAAGSAFVFTEVDGEWIERQEISNQVHSSERAVAIDGGVMAIVSADSAATVVDLYVLENGTWIQQGLLTRSDAQGEVLGRTEVALAGGTLIASANLEETVYVYDVQAAQE